MLPCFLVNCDNEKPLEEIVIEPDVCDSIGILKEGLHATVHNRDGVSWDFYIEDSVRISEFYRLWYPYPCLPVPDSLREGGLELIISYRDKTVWLDKTKIIMQGELITARRINDFPEEDPRNGENMGTFFVKNVNPYDTIRDSTFVFRNESDWNKFLALRPWASPSRKIDFNKYTLLSQRVVHGGCGWIFKRSFDQIAPHQYVYKVSAEIYGGCQVGIVNYHWVTVPKIQPEDTVLFKFEPVFHFWPS